MSRFIPALLFGLILSSVRGAEPAEPANGWRGNGTGLWPESKPPLEWYRLPKGVIADLRSRADRPGEKDADGSPTEKGIVRDWLVIGPFPMRDSVKEFDEAPLADDAAVQPKAGDKAGELMWKAMAAPRDDRWAFGPATPPIADLATELGKAKPNRAAYAHTYLYSPKGGTIRAVVDHTHGMKAWLNGKGVYSSAVRNAPLGSYYPLSKVEFGTESVHPSARFDLVLKPGWNRLLLKLTSFTREDEGWNKQTFLLRLMDLPTVSYDSKNILWMAELPHRSNASPIIVGKRIFVMSEPDELLCIDRDTGKILWTAANNFYEMLTPEERRAKPAYKEKIEPLLAALKKEGDFAERLGLRARLQKALQEIDFARFAWKADDHFQAHFGIVGFTSPSPLSDGKHVWVWCGNGVAACYDLEGKREWIARVEAKNLTYSSSPALADGTFGVYLGKLVGLDAQTGKVRWEQRQIDLNNGALLSARIAGVPVFVSSIGHVIRASDGKILYKEKNREAGASSWAPGVIRGDVITLPRYGAKHLLILDFEGATGETWEPKRSEVHVADGIPREPDGKGRDRSTAGSPLVVGDLAFTVDIYSTLYAFDLKAKKAIFHRDTELNGLFHYNAVPVAASPTLIGKHIAIQDNQGLSLILEPGREFKQVRKNHIATVLDRWWPVPAQETIGYAPPIADENRLYIRGERYLYCIGEK